MSQASLLSSGQITNLDTLNPPKQITSGKEGPGFLRSLVGNVAAVSADTAVSGGLYTTRYRMARIPSTAIIRRVFIRSAIASAGSADINLVWSDAINDGTVPTRQNLAPSSSLNGTEISPAMTQSSSNKLFGAAQSLVLSSVNTEFTFAGTYTSAMQQKHIWDALGYTTDPGGYLDFCIDITTAVTTGGDVSLEVQYID